MEEYLLESKCNISLFSKSSIRLVQTTQYALSVGMMTLMLGALLVMVHGFAKTAGAVIGGITDFSISPIMILPVQR